jgi:hypothetical protein
MPRMWIYFIALALPLAFRIVVVNTGLDEWLWYQRYPDAYYILSALKVNPLFLETLALWPLAFFTGTMFFYWTIDLDDEAIASQFLLLPIIYVPFSILGTWVLNWGFDFTLFYKHPLVLIPAGYLYLFPWIVFVWVFSKLRLVM